MTEVPTQHNVHVHLHNSPKQTDHLIETLTKTKERWANKSFNKRRRDFSAMRCQVLIQLHGTTICTRVSCVQPESGMPISIVFPHRIYIFVPVCGFITVIFLKNCCCIYILVERGIKSNFRLIENIGIMTWKRCIYYGLLYIVVPILLNTVLKISPRVIFSSK